MRTAPPRRQQMTSIIMMLALLVMILVMRRQCADGTAKMFDVMAPPAGSPAPAPSDAATPPARR